MLTNKFFIQRSLTRPLTKTKPAAKTKKPLPFFSMISYQTIHQNQVPNQKP